jgi:uncharacterized protein involved in outer membrane biogenesis
MRIRNLVIAAVALVVLLGLIFVVLASRVDSFRPRIQAEIQKKLGRQVEIGHLGLRLFPLAVRADGVTVSEAPEFSSSRPFATAKKLYVSVKLFSLIGGSPEVKNLILEQPQIELIHNKAGVWNFSTLGGSSQASAPASKSDSDSSGGISLNELKIDDGQVAITDQAANQPRSVYDHIDLKLTDFGPGKKFGLDVDAHFPGQGKQLLGFKGKVGPLNPTNSAATPVDGRISMEELSVAGFNRLSPGIIPPQTDAVLSGGADVTSQGTQISAKGNLKVQNAMLKGSKIEFPISSDYDLTADRSKNTIQVRSGKLDLGSTSFNVTGNVDAHATPANLDVRLKTNNSSITELAKIAGAFGVAFNPAYQIKGNVSADVAAKGPSNNPQLNGTVSLKQLAASGGEIKQPVSVPQLDLTLTPDTIKTNTFTATSGSTSVAITAAVSQYTTVKNVDATIKTNNANVAELLNMAKAYGVEGANGATGSGNLSADVHVQGPVSNLSAVQYSGNANFSNVLVNTPALTKPVSLTAANVQFSHNSVAVSNLNMAIGSSNLQGTLSAKNFAAPEVTFDISSNNFDVDELSNISAPAPKAAAQPAAAKAPAPTAATQASQESIILKATGSGKVYAKTVKAQGFVLTNTRADCKLNKGVATLSPLTTDIFGGKEAGAITLDMRPKNPLAAVNAKFTGVDTNALLSAVSTAKNTLYGSLAANTNLRFALVPAAELPRTLNGNLSFDVTNGELKNVNILNQISKIAQFTGSAPGQSGGNSTALQKLAGSMNIVNGLASTSDLTAALAAGSLAANGTMDLGSQALNMHMTAALASGASAAVGGTKVGGFLNTALANNKGELVIPVIVGGTMSSPSFAPDAAALAKMKLNNLLPSVTNPGKLANGILSGQGAGGVLNNLLGGHPPAQPGAQQQQQQPNAGDAINSLLNGFGKKKKKQ